MGPSLSRKGERGKIVAISFCCDQMGFMSPLPLPALHATHAGIWRAGGGEVREVVRGEAIAALAETPHVILNAPLVGGRLGYGDVSGLDLLELFAFVHPARFAVPTVAGMCRATGVAVPDEGPESAAALLGIAGALLDRLGAPDWAEREGAWTSAQTLWRLGWGWAPLVAERITKPERGERMLFSRLPQWDEAAERPPPRPVTVGEGEAIEKLAVLTGAGSGAYCKSSPVRSSARAPARIS